VLFSSSLSPKSKELSTKAPQSTRNAEPKISLDTNKYVSKINVKGITTASKSPKNEVMGIGKMNMFSGLDKTTKK